MRQFFVFFLSFASILLHFVSVVLHLVLVVHFAGVSIILFIGRYRILQRNRSDPENCQENTRLYILPKKKNIFQKNQLIRLFLLLKDSLSTGMHCARRRRFRGPLNPPIYCCRSFRPSILYNSKLPSRLFCIYGL